MSGIIFPFCGMTMAVQIAPEPGRQVKVNG
jgi:hypothetical protein